MLPIASCLKNRLMLMLTPDANKPTKDHIFQVILLLIIIKIHKNICNFLMVSFVLSYTQVMETFHH